jgi:mono/diheme cytochrome c family protein
MHGYHGSMTKSSMLARMPVFDRANARLRSVALHSILASALSLVGCAVELQNRQPAQEVAQVSKTPGSVYTGWRVFQDRCAGCHGVAATGSGKGPNLLPIVGVMGPEEFVSVVLHRYEWNLPATEGRERKAVVEGVMQRKEGALTMPAWQGEPRVEAHIVDLFAYLSARAEGTQGGGRPPR